MRRGEVTPAELLEAAGVEAANSQLPSLGIVAFEVDVDHLAHRGRLECDHLLVLSERPARRLEVTPARLEGLERLLDERLACLGLARRGLFGPRRACQVAVAGDEYSVIACASRSWDSG